MANLHSVPQEQWRPYIRRCLISERGWRHTALGPLARLMAP